MSKKQQKINDGPQQPQQEEVIQLIAIDSQQEMELQSGESTIQKTNQLNKLSNTQRYPNNCLFHVNTYFRMKNQKQNKVPKKYVPSFGTLVSQHLIVCTAHGIINKTDSDLEKLPQRIQIVLGNLKRVVDNYRFIADYQNQEVSHLNDVALLYFKEPIKRSKYIEIGIIYSFVSDKIIIPKVSQGKIEHIPEQHPEIDCKKESIVRYKIKTQKGESGSPILISKLSELNIYYLVGMHKAGIQIKKNKKKIYTRSEGILFNKKVFESIIKLESELVTNKSQRFINNASIEIEKRQAFFKEYEQNIEPSLRTELTRVNQQLERVYQEMPNKIPTSLQVKQQFKQLLSIMKQISLQDGQNKLQRLLQHLKQKLEPKAQQNQAQIIINEIYILIKKFCTSDRSCKQIKKLRRQFNSIMDKMTCGDILKNLPCPINDQTLLSLEDTAFFGTHILYLIHNRQSIKAFLNIMLEEQGTFWFGRQIKAKQEQQFDIQALNLAQLSSQGLGFQKSQECFRGAAAKICNQLKKSTIERYALTENQSFLIPYKYSAVVKIDIQKSIFLYVEQLQTQDWSSLQQIYQILKFYHAGQGNIIAQQKFYTKWMQAYASDQFQNSQLLSKIDSNHFRKKIEMLKSLSIGMDFCYRRQLIRKKYHCQSVHLIQNYNLIKSINSSIELHILVLNIVQQLNELHEQQYSLCCPIEYSVNINIQTFQVGFFYIGHPLRLTDFIVKTIENEQKSKYLFDQYPVQEILELSKREQSKNDFRRVDMWMLGKSIVKLMKRIQSKWVTESEYCQKLLSLIQNEVLVGLYDRIKIGSFKKQLVLLEKQYLA